MGVGITTGDSTPSSTDHTDFGAAELVGDTMVRTFSITNRGTGPLNLTGTPRVALSGVHATDYSVLQPGTSVAASGSTVFLVAFYPSGTGLRSALVSIASNDPDDNPFTFAIQGTGVLVLQPVIKAPNPTVLGNGSFQLTFTNSANRIFSVLASTNVALPASIWTVLDTATNAGGGIYRFTDPNAKNYPRRFHQLRYP